MSRIAIVGGHGQVARLLLPMLRAAGHEPLALVRREAYREELEGLGAEVGILDIEAVDANGFTLAFDGCDAVVFAAGGGGDGSAARKQTVDLEGSLKSVIGARQAGIDRVVQISAIGVDADPDPSRGETWTAYVKAKREADAALRDSHLAWTILRPGRLTDDPASGVVALGPEVERGEISRADVAATVAAVLDEPGSAGHQWDLVGGTEPIADAVRRLSRPA